MVATYAPVLDFATLNHDADLLLRFTYPLNNQTGSDEYPRSAKQPDGSPNRSAEDYHVTVRGERA